MGARRRAREAALQYLYQEDFGDGTAAADHNLDDHFSLFCEIYQISWMAREYAFSLINGVSNNKSRIDSIITSHAVNWRLDRLAATDRNILRLAVYEIMCGTDVPSQVAINEAVEIAKRFGGDESPAFINGILDKVAQLPQYCATPPPNDTTSS
jgi:N utilization substance protein B